MVWLLQIVSSHFKSDFFCKYGIARLLVKIMCLLDFHRICFLNLDVKWNHWALETAAGSPVPRGPQPRMQIPNKKKVDL